MEGQRIKNFLKKYKPIFPIGFQDLSKKAWNSIEIPLSAIVEHKPIIKNQAIVFPIDEVADLISNRILGPGPDEVLVKADFTLVSPGTERAALMALTYPRYDFPTFPGYSGSGEVISVGKSVKVYKPGDRVAGRLKHSLYNVLDQKWLFPIPSQISPVEAAFIELGIIVLQGIHKARIKPGESILVVGQGLIGQLTNRLCRIAGGAPVVATALSKAKSALAVSNGGADRFLPIDEIKNDHLESFDICFEATGDPGVLPFACRAVRPGGRVLLLGSPRSQASLPIGQNAISPGISLIGSHISGMPDKDRVDGLWPYRNEGQLFMDLVSRGILGVKDLVTHPTTPSDGGKVYELLKKGAPDLIGILFGWHDVLKSMNPPIKGIKYEK